MELIHPLDKSHAAYRINERRTGERKTKCYEVWQKNVPQEPAEELIPICSNCMKIRDSEGKWKHFENYLSEVYDIQFTHSICMECVEILYPDIAEKFKKLK